MLPPARERHKHPPAGQPQSAISSQQSAISGPLNADRQLLIANG